MTKKTLITSLFIGGILFVGCGSSGDKYMPNSPLTEQDFVRFTKQDIENLKNKYPNKEAWDKDFETLQKKCSYADSWHDWIRYENDKAPLSAKDMKEAEAIFEKMKVVKSNCGDLKDFAYEQDYSTYLFSTKVGESFFLKYLKAQGR